MQVDGSTRRGSFPLLLPEDLVADGFPSSSSCSSSSSSSSLLSSSSSSSVGPTAHLNYIEHRVSKMDTLAGVAIKYGVEVADIKRMNSLVTDLQMFALKSLKIPLPGRHPPSPITSNSPACNRDQNMGQQPHANFLESLRSHQVKAPQRRVSLAMSSLLGYYGLSSPENDPKGEGTEMAVYGAQISEPSYNSHQRSRSLVNGFLLENGHSVQGAAIVEATENCETDRSGSEKPVRRRQKIDVESPELSLKEDSDGTFSGKTEKSLAPRPKSINRLDFDSGFLAAIPMGDSILANGVKKSSSTSNLLESEGSSSMWLTSKWAMKPDATSKPLFDGLPRPITFRRNKAAMD